MIFFEDFAQILRTTFSTTPINACFQNSLGLSRPIAVNFCLCTTKTTHSRDILFPDILLSVLPFSNFIWFSHFYSTKYKLFFYFYIFWNLLYLRFVLKICAMFISNFWLLKNTCSITVWEKSYIWLIRKVEHCPTF